jgi:ribonuclease HII
MDAYHIQYPNYGLLQHKGYPTSMHMLAISKYGPTPIHRMTFAPLKYLKKDIKPKKVIKSKL